MVSTLIRATLLVALGVLASGVAEAQKSPPTPFTGLPTVPKTLPLIGGALATSPDEPVAAAAATGNADDVIALVDGGNDLDGPDRRGRTPLMYSAILNNGYIAGFLLQHGARLDLRDSVGYTALHWAAERGSIAVMRLLLSFHAPVNVPNAHGLTPLMLAASNNRTDAVRLLLENHADPTITDYTGRDALSWTGDHAVVAALLKSSMH
jgi:ankyrin repeat protein